MNEARRNPNVLARANGKVVAAQIPPHIPLGDGLGLFGLALVPVADGDSVRIALMGDIGRVSTLATNIEVFRIPLGDYGAPTKAELCAKFNEATAPKAEAAE